MLFFDFVKSRKIFLASAIFFVSFFYFVGSTFAESPKVNYRLGEILVKFKSSDELYKLKVPTDSDLEAIIKSYKIRDDVEYIEPNYLFKAASFPNDPDFTLQWYLTAINDTAFWSKELLLREQEGIARKSVIAVLDTGVYLDHPDLKSKIWNNKAERPNDNADNDGNGYIDDIHGWDFVDNDSDPDPTFIGTYVADAVKHGTIVAGIAAAATNNNLGIAGTSWFAQIMPLRVLDSSGNGDVYKVVKAVDYAINNGADVINMSFVGNTPSQPLLDAIKRAYAKNVLVVAAAGNTNQDINGQNLDEAKSYPVCYDGDVGENMVIGVAAVGRQLIKSSFSSYGSCIDIAAPGEDIYSTQVYQPSVSGFDQYYNGFWSGTSLSAPQVSGVIAAIKALRPNFSAATLRDIILGSAKDINSYNPLYQGKLGAGLLDAGKALEMALGQKITTTKSGQNNYVIAGLGNGSFPQIKILKTDGTVFKSFFAYSPYFTGPINIAAGDVNGDGIEDVVTAAGIGGGPHIRIFNINGQLISQFFAYNVSSRGGAYLAVGDVNGDGIDEIVTGAGRGLAPEVKVFDYKGRLLSHFMAYAPNFHGGVRIALGDVNKDGKAELVTGVGPGGGPHVRIFDQSGVLVSQFFAFNQDFRGGISVGAGDVNGDGVADVVVGAGAGTVPTVRVFYYNGIMLNSFFAFDSSFLKGINVAVADVDNNGSSSILVGQDVGGSDQIRIFSWQGDLKYDLPVQLDRYKGGVRPAVIQY
ncbi:MAG: S8 family serine peptidase [Patescibacteria group bacterium]|nr:S8 family serine peptidase [Patescibacteria group bacterium]